jgi:hypothetical protein
MIKIENLFIMAVSGYTPDYFKQYFQKNKMSLCGFCQSDDSSHKISACSGCKTLHDSMLHTASNVVHSRVFAVRNAGLSSILAKLDELSPTKLEAFAQYLHVKVPADDTESARRFAVLNQIVHSKKVYSPQYGYHGEIVAECPVCLTTKTLKRTQCNHHVCSACTHQIKNKKCPLCRQPM